MSEGVKVSVGGKTLLIDKKIGEGINAIYIFLGGFATIYLAHDRANEQFVLKKMILRVFYYKFILYFRMKQLKKQLKQNLLYLKPVMEM